MFMGQTWFYIKNEIRQLDFQEETLPLIASTQVVWHVTVLAMPLSTQKTCSAAAEQILGMRDDSDTLCFSHFLIASREGCTETKPLYCLVLQKHPRGVHQGAWNTSTVRGCHVVGLLGFESIGQIDL